MTNREILRAVLECHAIEGVTLLPGEPEVILRRREGFLLSRERVESILVDLERLEGYDVAAGYKRT